MMKLRIGFWSSMLMLSLFFVGCADPCADVVCDHGECGNGDCICDPGYTGDRCETPLNAKFSGTYTLEELCTYGADGPYSVSFAAVTTSPIDITVTGLYDSTQTQLHGTAGSDGLSFYIPRQVFSTGIDIESSSGTISSDAETIILSYRMKRHAPDSLLEICTATLRK
jgi:hypothetical protein